MDAIANFLSSATGRNLDDETVETITIFCGIGLLILLLFLTYGLDLLVIFTSRREPAGSTLDPVKLLRPKLVG